jgi:hypothetical protein
MRRINIYRSDNEGKNLIGWFDADQAQEFREDTRWNGHNRVSVHTADQFTHQSLYRTAAGRWVIEQWSQWDGAETTHRFVPDERAREWLLVNGSDDVVERYFGEIEEERGPGRPEIGKAINWRPGDDLLPRIDAEADRRGKSRADTLRELVKQALGLDV